MIDGRSLLDQIVKNNLKTYDNIGKIATSQGDYYMTSCLLGYNYFNKHDKTTTTWSRSTTKTRNYF